MTCRSYRCSFCTQRKFLLIPVYSVTNILSRVEILSKTWETAFIWCWYVSWNSLCTCVSPFSSEEILSITESLADRIDFCFDSVSFCLSAICFWTLQKTWIFEHVFYCMNWILEVIYHGSWMDNKHRDAHGGTTGISPILTDLPVVIAPQLAAKCSSADQLSPLYSPATLDSQENNTCLWCAWKTSHTFDDASLPDGPYRLQEIHSIQECQCRAPSRNIVWSDKLVNGFGCLKAVYNQVLVLAASTSNIYHSQAAHSWLIYYDIPIYLTQLMCLYKSSGWWTNMSVTLTGKYCSLYLSP